MLPEAIQLELDGRYPAMFSYKMKNYVLLDPQGKLLIKGSGLRSRGIELFQRQWMEEMFHLLLTGRRDEIPALVRRWEEDFRAHRVPVKLFMKTETLQDSLPAYQAKLRTGARNASAAYELALRSARPYQPGDQVSYYVAGDGLRIKVNEMAKLATSWDPEAPDENTAVLSRQGPRAVRQVPAVHRAAGTRPRHRGRDGAGAGRAVLRDVTTRSESCRERGGASSLTRSSRLRAGNPTSRASAPTRCSIASRYSRGAEPDADTAGGTARGPTELLLDESEEEAQTIGVRRNSTFDRLLAPAARPRRGGPQARSPSVMSGSTA